MIPRKGADCNWPFAENRDNLFPLLHSVRSKIKMLLQLKEQAEIVISINAAHIEMSKRRGDLGITYDMDVMRLIDAFRAIGLYVGSVVITCRRGLVGKVHRMLERQIPDREGLIFRIARAVAAAMLVIELAQARRHFAGAYEAATADLADVNMIDPFHLEAYGVTTVNYNRDIEIFPVD